MRTITILLIEDNTQDIRLIKEMLKEIRSFNYNLVSAATLKEGCEQIQKSNFGIILLDLNLPDSTGRQTFQKVIDCCKEIPIILVTGNEDQELSLKLIMEGAQDYITKQNLNPDLLEKSILYSIERQALLRNIKIQNVQIDRIEKERTLIAKLPSQDPDPILRVAGNGKLLYINEAGTKLLPDWQLIINETIPSRLKDIIDPIFIEGTNIKFELCHRELIYSFYAVPLIEEGYINLYGRDITERMRAEDAIRQSRKELDSLFDASPEMISFIGFDGYFKRLNPAWVKTLGYPMDKLLSLPFIEFIHPDDREATNAEAAKLAEGHRTIRFENRYRCNDGSYRWLVWSIIPDTKEKLLYAIARDITERKQAERKLTIANKAILQSEENFRRSISGSPLGIRIVAVDGKTIYANKAFLDIYEFNRLEEFTSLPAINRYTPESYAQHQKRKEKREKGHDVFDYEISIIRKNAEIRHVKVLRKEILWNGIKHYQVINIDITEQKKLTLDLIAAKEHAEESDRLKSAFLANMSHEIRTPMNGILGFAGLLKEPDLTGEVQQEYIRIIEKSGARMLNIINDIVDISKIESGQMGVSISETNVNEQTEYIYAFFKPETDQKGLQFFLKNTLPAKEAIIKTDREKVNAILTNLVKNAIKFTHKGSIEIGYNLKPTEPVELEFFVKDTGTGISQEQKKIIFERFRQGSESLTRNYEGAGLGLSISKAFVEMLGGRIWVESEEGKGAIFYFTIPYNTELEEKRVVENIIPADKAENHIKSLKILIADDDEISGMLITKAIKVFCKEVLKARTGVEAVETCRNNPDIDLVLMDIKMPEMGGYEATRQIRQFNTDVVIIAQTAYALSGDREMAIDAGCNDYISKPLDMALLKATIIKYFK